MQNRAHGVSTVTDTVQPQRSLPGQRLALPPVLDGELGAVVPAVEAVVPPQGDQVIAVEIKINAQLITFISIVTLTW